MDTQTELELFAAVAEAFDEDKECEHDFHSAQGQGKFHSGKAGWYMQTACLTCDRRTPVLAVCGRFKEIAETQDTQCFGCLTVAPTNFLVKERIKGA